MDGEFDSIRKNGLVKAAVSMYGGRILEGNSAKKKPQMDLLEKRPSKARELQLVRTNISQIEANKAAAESEKAGAELELLKAKKMVKDLTIQIDESSSKTRQQQQQIQKLAKPRKCEEGNVLVVEKAENRDYAEVMTQLESLKQELSKLRLDIAHVVREKSRAENEAKASSSKIQFYLHSAEALRKEVEEANEEQVLVELARIEAVKELADIETQRKEAAGRFSSSMDETRKRMDALINEIDHARKLEAELAITNSDIDMLQNQLSLEKEMEKRANSGESSEQSEVCYHSGKKQESFSQLQAVDEELEAAKKELASIRRGGFQLMASMDIIRKEREHLSEEMARAKKSEEEAENTMKIPHSKLLRAKDKLEVASTFEQQAKAMLSSMSFSLDQLNTEAEAAKKKRELIIEETANIKTGVREIESQTDLAEDRLNGALLELEEVKASEAKALEKLKTIAENARRTRASAAEHSSKITISRFEYEYLSGCAAGAKEIADKKVEAAKAWIESLKVSGKEILMKTEVAEREIRQLRMKKEEEIHRAEKSIIVKELIDRELDNWREREENFHSKLIRMKASPKKSMTDNRKLTLPRRAWHRKSSSPLSRDTTRFSPITLKKRRKVMLNFATYFASKQIDKGPKLEKRS